MKQQDSFYKTKTVVTLKLIITTFFLIVILKFILYFTLCSLQ